MTRRHKIKTCGLVSVGYSDPDSLTATTVQFSVGFKLVFAIANVFSF